MDEISSTEFRRRYATLTKPTVVTVNGHAIGEWTPFNAHGLRPLPAPIVRGSFNSQPFTGPIPKKGR